MDYKEAIQAINNNFPDERYSILREALTLAIRTMNNANSPIEPKLHCVIVNGEPHEETYRYYKDKGWIILYTDKASRFHPYAVDTDTILFMAKPIDKEEYDKYMNDAKKEHLPESAE